MNKVASEKHLSPRVALWQLGLWQTFKGALILGIFVGCMAIIQGIGYASTYPDEKSRAAFTATMESAPALGILYGETKNLASSAGYMVYRTVPIMTLVASIWGLMTVTKLLRGQEEDGRWEVITSASSTPKQTTSLLLLGFGSSLAAACLTSTVIIAIGSAASEINISIMATILLTLAIFLPAALFSGISVFVSQLSITRRRAVMYGLAPLAALFMLRAIANTVPDLYWLKNITPFGWSDQTSPIFDSQAAWLVPAILLTILFVTAGVYLAAKRDLGAGFIPESTTQKPHLYLLGSPAALALRQNISLFIGWGVAALSVSIILASIMSIAAEAVADSPSLGAIVSRLGGSVTDLKIAFLGAGMMFIVIILLIMAAVCVASIRKDEAKNYLDNLLTQPVRRSSWLGMRLLLIIAAFTTISMLCSFATWFTADLQGISLNLGSMLLISVTLTGTVLFILGFGTLLYGFLPRLAAIGMYAVIAWSFLIDIVSSVIKLDDFVINSSLLHYISLSPIEAPDWKTFTGLLLLGGVMATIGIVAFTKRDIITE